MATLTAEYDRSKRDAGDIIEYGMADDALNSIYKGMLVMFNTEGYIIPAADTASCVFAGIAAETVLQVADPGADGTNKVNVYTSGDFLIAFTGGTAAVDAADIGKDVAMDGDHAVDLLADTGQELACGIIVDFDGTSAWVRIDRIAPVSSAS